MVVGYVYPDDYTGSGGEGGVYNCETGAKISGTTDFKWVAGVTSCMFRAFFFYSTLVGNTAYMYGPRVELCNGLEVPLETILPVIKRTPKYLGTTTANPPDTTTFSSERIPGDWCLSTAAKQFYRWDGSAWATSYITQGMKSAGFMDLIAIADASDTQLFAQQLVAVDAFINQLTASTAFLENLFSKYIKATGSIRAGDRYNADGTVSNNSKDGIWIGSNGIMKAKGAELGSAKADSIVFNLLQPGDNTIKRYALLDSGGTGDKSVTKTLHMQLCAGGTIRVSFQYCARTYGNTNFTVTIKRYNIIDETYTTIYNQSLPPTSNWGTSDVWSDVISFDVSFDEGDSIWFKASSWVGGVTPGGFVKFQNIALKADCHPGILSWIGITTTDGTAPKIPR